ncbi:hypothetical protein [Pseudomonas lijiangensis]|uniref:Uncharacterized protein n=1 Tax=Pseudomonas lijiangensis TaxID=2995658 RepID=A0ABX8HWD0_9PSED|nr:hypothetical protein [Pseudomonas lijiangensis]MBX8499334.1 hypothetical protein [Pseudomonas lijiangensis]MBX8504913.1 hypothetical protein [Pseudomonas lijiangensis]QWU84946.1 hypothetical protein KQP88_09355 [Pseudomonas lijiangensis]
MKNQIIASAAILVLLNQGPSNANELPAKNPGYKEISMYDLPTGSSKNLEKAMIDYNKANTNGEAKPDNSLKIRPLARVEKEIKEIKFPAYKVYDEPDARSSWEINPKKTVTDYSLLKIQPNRIQTLQTCDLKSTQYNGIYRKSKYTGFAQFYDCAGEKVYLRDMLLEGIKITGIKEQNNVELLNTKGVMYGIKNSQGKSFTNLSWTSKNIHHIIERDGTNSFTRAWLIRYANEVISLEEKTL